MNRVDMIENVLIIALIASFLILLFTKIGLRERVQVFGPKLISEMVSCDFCLSFWVCAVLSVIFFIFAGKDENVLVYPFLACPLTRLLI